MQLTIVDPRTGQRMTVAVTRKPMPGHQARRQVLRKLEQLEAEQSRR